MGAKFELRTREHLADPDRKRRYNERHFAVAASRYDLATRAMSLGLDRRWKERLVAALPDLPSPFCVDLACGTGDVARLLARRYPGGTIVGVDLVEPMLALARSRRTDPRVSFRQADMAATGLPDGTADVVAGSYALRNAADLPGAIREIRRILRPGGTAAFLDFAKPPSPLLGAALCRLLQGWCGLWGLLLHGTPEIHGYIGPSLAAFPDRERLAAMFREAGFALLRRERFFPGATELVVLTAEGRGHPAAGDPARSRRLTPRPPASRRDSSEGTMRGFP